MSKLNLKNHGLSPGLEAAPYSTQHGFNSSAAARLEHVILQAIANPGKRLKWPVTEMESSNALRNRLNAARSFIIANSSAFDPRVVERLENTIFTKRKNDFVLLPLTDKAIRRAIPLDDLAVLEDETHQQPGEDGYASITTEGVEPVEQKPAYELPFTLWGELISNINDFINAPPTEGQDQVFKAEDLTLSIKQISNLKDIIAEAKIPGRITAQKVVLVKPKLTTSKQNDNIHQE